MKSIALIICLSLVPTLSYAKDGMGHQGPMKKLFKKLDLSKEQRAKIKEIRKANKQTHQALKEKKFSTHKAFLDALSNDKASDSELRSLHQKSVDAMSALKIQGFETSLKIRQELTPEQRGQFAIALKERMEKKKMGRRGKKGKHKRSDKDD